MPEYSIKRLCLDSRRIEPGDLFIAVPGLTTDGRNYIKEAIDKGAAAILAENHEHLNAIILHQTKKIPIIPYDKLIDAMGYIAARFYSEPAKFLNIMGVTGTNGKTSCTHFYAQLYNHLNAANARCAVMGTLGIGFLDALKESGYTTPDAIVTQESLARVKNEGAKALAMEVTSHALSQRRINGITFNSVIFTNLSRDHLDDHLTMEEYWRAKKRLFTEYSANYQILNIDDVYGRRLFMDCFNQRQALESNSLQKWPAVIGYSAKSFQELLQTNPIEADIFKKIRNDQQNLDNVSVSQKKSLRDFSLMTTESLILDQSGIQAKIASPWGEGNVHCPLWGRFNLCNLLATIAALCVDGYALLDVCQTIPMLKPVNGRMTILKNSPKNPSVIIDFAHTPNALQEVLIAIKPHCQGKIWCVFGCGGNRDPGKRPLMAAIAEQYSDEVIVTQDNPRLEDPDQIINDILRGFKNTEHVHIESDRRKAIEYAILNAKENDVVIIAGKGHEDYQLIQQEKIPFNDQKIAEQYLKQKDSI